MPQPADVSGMNFRVGAPEPRNIGPTSRSGDFALVIHGNYNCALSNKTTGNCMEVEQLLKGMINYD